jgi:hypothetical protein
MNRATRWGAGTVVSVCLVTSGCGPTYVVSDARAEALDDSDWLVRQRPSRPDTAAVEPASSAARSREETTPPRR